MDKKVPLCKPELNEKEINSIKEVLDSGWLAHGPKVKEFENRFAKYIGTKYAISLNSCASALQAAIMAHELNGEIILPSFTFPASANAIENAGCKPVFVDIREDTFNIDANEIKKNITDKTVGIMPVHYAGQSCEMDNLMELAEQHNLVIIEDSAEAIGTLYNDKKTGSFGTGCFSFYPTKNMTTGEGGMVTTDNKKIAEKVKAIRGHGIVKGAYERNKLNIPWIRVASMSGYNFRMNEISAALGLRQLEKLDEMNEKRQKLAEYMTKKLSKFRRITTPYLDPKGTHVYQMYVIKLNKNVDRDKFTIFLRENGIEASVHFDPPVHLHTYYSEKYGYNEEDLPITEKISKQIVTLPMFPSLTKNQIDLIVNVIEKALRKNG